MKRCDFPLKTSFFLSQLNLFCSLMDKAFVIVIKWKNTFQMHLSNEFGKKNVFFFHKKRKECVDCFFFPFFHFVKEEGEQCEWIKSLTFCESNAFYFNISHCAQKERKRWESSKRDLLWFCYSHKGINMNMDLSSIKAGCVFVLYCSFFIHTVLRGGERKRRYLKKRKNG